jgi:hypothetical protein
MSATYLCPICGKKTPQKGSTIRFVLGMRRRVCGSHAAPKPKILDKAMYEGLGFGPCVSGVWWP